MSRKMTYSIGLTYGAGLLTGGFYGGLLGIRQGGATPKLFLNSVLNSCSRYGPALANQSAIITMYYVPWRTFGHFLEFLDSICWYLLKNNASSYRRQGRCKMTCFVLISSAFFGKERWCSMAWSALCDQMTPSTLQWPVHQQELYTRPPLDLSSPSGDIPWLAAHSSQESTICWELGDFEAKCRQNLGQSCPRTVSKNAVCWLKVAERGLTSSQKADRHWILWVLSSFARGLDRCWSVPKPLSDGATDGSMIWGELSPFVFVHILAYCTHNHWLLYYVVLRCSESCHLFYFVLHILIRTRVLNWMSMLDAL